MKKKSHSRTKTPNIFQISRDQKRKKSEGSRVRKRSIKVQKQEWKIQKNLHATRCKLQRMSQTQIGHQSISKVLDEGEIEFMNKYQKTRQENQRSGAKNKRQKYEYISVIGYGLFGKVWKVKDKASGKPYAIKQMSKPEIILKKGLRTCFNQREILSILHHHLIPTLYSAFQSELDLHFVFPWLAGGDLRYHITKFKFFKEKEVRFFAACIISTLEYLRQKNILHRDLKPQNLILDSDSYLCLVDYGIASNIVDSISWLQCGTPAYMAPQVLFQKQPKFQSDYYSLGVILYQMILGERPYRTSDKVQLKQKMLKSSITIRKKDIPEGWSIQAIDFVNRLLKRNPRNRLGSSGIKELKDHAWLINFPWNDLQCRKLESPYKQSFKEWQIDFTQFEDRKIEKDHQKIEKELIKGNMQEIFNGFDIQIFEKSVQWSTRPSLQIRH